MSKYSYYFSEQGGYDCMTDAYIITDGVKTIAKLDLADFGQESCRDASPDMRRLAEILVTRMVVGLNT